MLQMVAAMRSVKKRKYKVKKNPSGLGCVLTIKSVAGK